MENENLKWLYILIPIGLIVLIYLIRKLREYQWGWVRNTESLKGKLYIITGANTGLGFETTKALVKRDAKVILACRNLQRANTAIEKIQKFTKNGQMIALELDLASFASIRSFASRIKEDYGNFDCLINNAGLISKLKEFTAENFEIHFGVNYLGHFLLFKLLEDNIKRNKARIVVVSSRLHEKGEIDFENLGKFKESTLLNPVNYNNSKLANSYFAKELYSKGYDCHVLCPGICFTDVQREYLIHWYHYILLLPISWLFVRSAEQGAQNIIHCATDNINTEKENPSTGYLIQSLKQVKSAITFSDVVSEKLWEESEKLCGIH